VADNHYSNNVFKIRLQFVGKSLQFLKSFKILALIRQWYYISKAVLNSSQDLWKMSWC